jgi:hypothetical protein
MNHESTTKTRSGERKPKVTRQFPNSTLFDTKDYAYSIGVGVLDDANRIGLDEALKRYVEARPALKYAEDMASKTIDLENDTGVYAELYRVLRFKGLCASQLESDIREACVLGAKHFSDDKAEDKAGDSVFFKLFLALAFNSESEKSIIKTEYSDSQIKAFLTKANMAVFSKGSGVSVPRLEMIKVHSARATDKERTAIIDEMNSTLSLFDTVSIDNAQIRAPLRWDG